MLEVLLDRGASPNVLVIQKDFAPIHYAAGMPNEGFSEEAMRLFMCYDGLFLKFNKNV